MTHLEQIRAWRAAAPGRVLVLHGHDGRAGVTLVAFVGLTRLEATYSAPAVAAAALSAGAVRWQRRLAVDGADVSDAKRLRFGRGERLHGATARGRRLRSRARAQV